MDQNGIAGRVEGTHDNICKAIKELFDFFVSPDNVS